MLNKSKTNIFKSTNGMHKDADDGDWITINGAHVLTGEDGSLQGEVGAKISASSSGTKQKGRITTSQKSSEKNSTKYPTTDKINPSWNKYNQTVAKTHLANYGKIFVDEYGDPIDDEFEVANRAGDDFYDTMTTNQLTNSNITPSYKKSK